MTTASVIFGIVVIVLVSASSVVSTVLVSRSLADAFRALDRITDRFAGQQDRLLDRFQAIRWEDLAALRSLDDPDQEGGFIPPDQQGGDDDEAMRVQYTNRIGGVVNGLGMSLTPAEQELLDEDFDEEQTPRREAS